MPPKKDDKRGLKTELHPALRSSNFTLIKEQQREVNPYLATSAKNSTPYRHKLLRFHKPGEVSAIIERQREERKTEDIKRRQDALRLQELDKKRNEEEKLKILSGELPDLSIGEDKFLKNSNDIPDTVEWWDKIYLDQTFNILQKYEDETYNSDDEDEDDETPSISYVQHPIPIKVHDIRVPSKVYLTKKEQKKLRREKRKLKREEIETKIKLGLQPKPEPKVKVSNMMNVLESNQNITDPTSWEKTVKEQQEERKRKHYEMNEKRHEEAIKKRKALHNNQTLTSAYNSTMNNCCKIYWFKNVQNPRIRFKLKANSKQLSLRGACLRVKDEGSGIIIVIGEEKNCNFYDKLVMKRIKWDESFEDKSDKTGNIIAMTGNYVKKVWEGYLDFEVIKFPRGWFMKVCETEEALKSTLQQFNAESFCNFLIE
ncbi:hypothetical protein KAFR_0H00650 [Kazachstania africana CBS 2517]|uniref:Pre-mRNA-splicing factor 3 domain-containing protein n=1 Tax=Kazachstania africana (strain ATCC 22294 / BCRC 22015 / CBS 2517 / CECT 1963 / NBRC 1671 / NRRL Y-8276) TaxID=1071382 RepID=H2AYR8_KAZAF|nr:hypothetical protein KAFR_0H00650 [Kazachstania africana CBS 2517]CCF59474.1 hypothetical protein KAFR_0H00650 [Kazachstania africana CBS 2517]